MNLYAASVALLWTTAMRVTARPDPAWRATGQVEEAYQVIAAAVCRLCDRFRSTTARALEQCAA